MKLIPAVESRYRVLFVPMFLCFTLFGLSLTIIGPALPKIIPQFGWSYTVTGLVLAASSVSYFLSTFIGGMVIRHVGPKAVIVGGLLLQAAGLAMFGLTPSAAVNILLQLIIGCGGGATEVVINYAVVRMETNGQSRLMNLMHAAFAIGAILCPLAVGAFVRAGAPWQTMYRIVAAASLVMAVGLAVLPFSRLRTSASEQAEEPSVWKLLREPILVVYSVILLVYVGVEIGVCNWVAEYYVRILQAPEWIGAFMVSVFWAGLLVGRSGVSFLYHGRHPERVLVALAGLATAALLATVFVSAPQAPWPALKPWTAGAGFFLTGLGYSAIYPLVMSLLGQLFPRGQAVAVGAAGTGGGIGSFILPFIMAALSDRIGIYRGFYCYVILNVVMGALIVAAAAMVRRRAA
jgi:fucose permease